MLTKLVEGETPLSCDPQLMLALSEEPYDGWGDFDEFIGVMNDAGRIYRMIAADGPHEAESVIERLGAAGMRNRVEGAFEAGAYVLVDTETRARVRGWNAVFCTVDARSHPVPRLTQAMVDLFIDVFE